MSLIRTIQNKITTRSTAIYQRALTRFGIQDCPEARITSAVAVCVALYYVCAILQAVVNIAADAAPLLTAFITQ